MAAPLDLSADVVDVTAALIDIPSESHHETAIADAIEGALLPCEHLTVHRSGNALIAQTRDAEPTIVIAGHLDTVPAAGNLPHRIEGGLLYGLGACDMKGGLAIALTLAHNITAPSHGVRFIFYDGEEVAAVHNGLARLAQEIPNVVKADLAIVMEPSNGVIEGGCQGTIRVEVRVEGERAHSARAWQGTNAIHGAAQILTRLDHYQSREPMVDGLRYREGLNAVGISGGVAGNVIPDECVVTVNYRFAPDRSVPEAIDHVHEIFAGFDVTVVDEAPGARPGLLDPTVASFVEAMGGQVEPKFGWTDVARFASVGTPAVNFGPGNPSIAHTVDESVSVSQIREMQQAMTKWLATA
ncbi:MAG TPA: succinyl-diaminopimelate desuccinylase [Acidimicrobiia bacterium]